MIPSTSSQILSLASPWTLPDLIPFAVFFPCSFKPWKSTPCFFSCSFGLAFSAACWVRSAALDAASARISLARRMMSETRVRNESLVTIREAMVRNEEIARWASRESSCFEGTLALGALRSMSMSAVEASYCHS